MSIHLTTGLSKLARFSKDFILCLTEKGFGSPGKLESVEKLRRSIAFKYSLDRLDFRFSPVSVILEFL